MRFQFWKKLWLSKESEERPYLIELLERGTILQAENPSYYSILEFAEGGDMLDRIRGLTIRGRQLSLSCARRYFLMLAKGLHYIHKRNVSHLDISMENVLITKADELRICDFGQAEQKRYCKGFKGKTKYVAPEVYAGEEFDGFKADVWSVGIVLWAMLTGGLVYRHPCLKDSRFQLLTLGKPGILKLLEVDQVWDVPDIIIDLLSKMLNVDPTQRPLIEDVLSHPWVDSPPGSSPKGQRDLHALADTLGAKNSTTSKLVTSSSTENFGIKNVTKSKLETSNSVENF